MIINTGIIIAFFVFVLLVLLSGLIVVFYYIGKRTVKNDSNKALILIKNGLNVDKIYKGIFHETAKNGISYNYDKDKYIFVPKHYNEVYIKNKRLIFVNQIGRLIALPFVDDKPLTEEESSNLIYEMCSTHIGADGMRALKGKSSANIIVIAIIAFAVGMAVILVFNQVSASRQQVRQQPSQQPSQTIIKEQ